MNGSFRYAISRRNSGVSSFDNVGKSNEAIGNGLHKGNKRFHNGDKYKE